MAAGNTALAAVHCVQGVGN